MRKRTKLNMFLLAVVAAGAPIALAPSPAMAVEEETVVAPGESSGGTCCPAASGSCYLNLGGTIVRESPAYHQTSGTACP